MSLEDFRSLLLIRNGQKNFKDLIETGISNASNGVLVYNSPESALDDGYDYHSWK